MSDTISMVGQEDEFRKWHYLKRLLLFAAPCLLLLVVAVAIGPIINGFKQDKANARMQQTRMIGQYLFCYSADNHGMYPDGDSSTEVFQKLLDGGYVSDPGVFYLPSPVRSNRSPGIN